ncbi:glycine betaine/L-proline ABC transporter ATP-binding protein ProV [Basfia succiniciproducens]|uniref:Quaternary amine transport ATP-binding protein n=1 Tax=Basfia succiniciproducens TaxID=653940 RepID=A0A1G5B742_9PAST|nr:glycine betaine/L-proline ABC transporter ATP-binding protein ProV [Basfia succiniciproducens]QIM68002.1 glycine betaine/L-proline ABC transporter ATP-binding protein [Basfia succiniciproducens]SCX85927.1 glycine betaine/proline transport system ATP-binding protein [Basfia succiniciproducens]
MTTSVKISVKNLTKIFGSHPKSAFKLLQNGKTKEQIFAETGSTVAVNNVSLDIMAGEIFVIMGLSGSGKSTLIRLLNRLIEPSAGHVFIGDDDIAEMSEKALRAVRRKRISMVFQSFALMPHMTILENVAFGLELSGVNSKNRRRMALETLARVGLEAYADVYPGELSGGMQQRVGLARALANDPEILLMDEAFSALDPLIRTEMQDELLRLQENSERTIVFISHDLDEAMRIGNRIAIMQDGQVIQVGRPDEILQNPANDYIRSFIQGVNVSNVLSAKDIASKRHLLNIVQKSEDETPHVAFKLLEQHERDFAVVLDRYGYYKGMVSVDSLQQARSNRQSLSQSFIEITPLSPEQSISDIINDVATTREPLPVVDDKGHYYGVVTKVKVLQTLNRGTEA